MCHSQQKDRTQHADNTRLRRNNLTELYSETEIKIADKAANLLTEATEGENMNE